MAWKARSGLKLDIINVALGVILVGMAWEARSGLKPRKVLTGETLILTLEWLVEPVWD